MVPSVRWFSWSGPGQVPDIGAVCRVRRVRRDAVMRSALGQGMSMFVHLSMFGQPVLKSLLLGPGPWFYSILDHPEGGLWMSVREWNIERTRGLLCFDVASLAGKGLGGPSVWTAVAAPRQVLEKAPGGLAGLEH